MASLLVPRDQVEAVLIERIQAGEELATKAEIAENAGGWRDWLFLLSTWREHTIAELTAVYEGEDIPFEFDAVTTTADHSTPQFTFPYAKSSLEMGLRELRLLVERLALAVEPEALRTRPRKFDEVRQEHGTGDARPTVFIVHGRAAGGFRDGAARFVEQLGLNAVVLSEQANEGRTLIEKFEAKALDVEYAIVLLTPEDSAYGPDDEAPPRPNRARQNVILELGYFMAKLGRKSVVALLQEGVELPTDLLGIVYIPLDDGGAWKTLLARELQAAGYDIDLRTLVA